MRENAVPLEHAATPPDVGSIDEFVQRDKRLLATLPRVFRVMDSVLKSLMVVLLVVLVSAVGTNMFGRYVLDRSLAVSDELARFLFIWVIFLGGALAHLHREHIEVDILVQRLPHSLRRAIVVLQELLILALMVALLMSAREVMATSPGTSPLLGIPYSWVNLSVPVGAAVIALITLYRLACAVRPGERHSQEA